MNVEDIKSKYTMRDILDRYGIKTDRTGFCHCCFHNGDRTPSMKVYRSSFYCFGCGAGGDIIKFVQLHDHLSFKEACKWISGEELSERTRYQLTVSRLQQKEKAQRKQKCKQDLKDVINQLAPLWQKVLSLAPTSREDPFPDEWCAAYNKWETLCYKQELLLKELGDL